jgi:hypothetical protein
LWARDANRHDAAIELVKQQIAKLEEEIAASRDGPEMN